LVCRVTGFDRVLWSLILPCSDETRGGVGTLPGSDKTGGTAGILPCSDKTWVSKIVGLEFDAGNTESGSPAPGSNFLPRVLLDDWGGRISASWGRGFDVGMGLVRDRVLAAGGGLDSDATSSCDDDASESSPVATTPERVVTFTRREMGKSVGKGSAM